MRERAELSGLGARGSWGHLRSLRATSMFCFCAPRVTAASLFREIGPVGIICAMHVSAARQTGAGKTRTAAPQNGQNEPHDHRKGARAICG